eukprot:TRINITY_DN618_c0_g1_i2.p1 TRINITY_DN618_c0_g1~~TRINITY_DN618_c0_g1_i2.p1  ORF type:complete len:1313 (-),score=340.47 TRINITY_DN618_c0_g1_i2:2175-5564(-)
MMNLPGLTFLNLRSNLLSSVYAFPSSSLLDLLDLGHNMFTTLPQTLTTLKSLTSLYIDGNYLLQLPDFSPLTSLTNLDAQSNLLTSLSTFPSNIETIDLSSNYLTAIPDSIYNLKKLQSFTAKSNNLTAFPKLNENGVLTSLDLGTNLISELPSSFSSFINLATIFLQNNNLTTITAFPPNVISINVNYNPLVEISSSFSNLGKLESFEFFFSHFQSIPSFPLTTKYADIGWGKLTALPSNVGTLKSLTYLSLTGNSLTSIPFFLSTSTLQYLFLSKNQLTNISSQVSALTSLSGIFINGNDCLKFKVTDFSPILSCSDTCSTSDAYSSQCSKSQKCMTHFCECNPLLFTLCNANSFCYWDGNSTCLSAIALTCDQIRSESQCAGASAKFQTVSCSWCESSGTCMETKSFSNCVVCGEKSESQCENYPQCHYCTAENSCHTKTKECESCVGLDEPACSRFPNCKLCGDNKECMSLSETCKNCSMASSSVGCTPICKWCSGISTCVSNSSVCSTCNKYSGSSCPTSSGCLLCGTTGKCQHKNDSCPDCSTIPSGSVCRSNVGCSWCSSKQKCQTKGSTDACPACDKSTTSDICKSLSGCNWCSIDSKCADNTVTCANCKSKTSESCGNTYGSCTWCSLLDYCGNSSLSCLSCDKILSSSICSRFSECEWNSGCVWVKEDKTSKSNTTTIVVIVVVLVVVAIVSALILVLLKRKKFDGSFGETSNEMSSSRFAEISEKTTNKELQQEINMLPEFASLAQLSLESNMNEIIFKDSLEVNKEAEIGLTITNKGSMSAEIELFYTPSRDPHDCTIEPQSAIIHKNESHSMRVILSMCCTARLQTTIVVVLKGRGYCSIPVKAESSPSSYLSLEEVQLGKVLGKGSFGQVYLGKYRGETVAVKQLNVTQSDITAIQTESVEQEIKLMTQLRSPFIVSFFGAMRSTNSIYIVLEWCKYGSLTSQLKNHKLNASVKKLIALDCAKGMQFLHTNKIIHRDLKTENVLLVSLSENSQIRGKISDFGTSRVVGSSEKQKMTAAVGTPNFIAPEVLGEGSQTVYSLSSDVYSFAMLLWQLWTEQEPFSDFKTVFAIFTFVQSGKRLDIPSDCPFKQLIENSWSQNPDSRPSFNEIVSILSQ